MSDDNEAPHPSLLPEPEVAPLDKSTVLHWFGVRLLAEGSALATVSSAVVPAVQAPSVKVTAIRVRSAGLGIAAVGAFTAVKNGLLQTRLRSPDM